MSALSDQLLVYAILGYTLAMLAYAVEYAFGTRGVVNRVATRELVGAGAPVDAPVAVEEVRPAPLDNARIGELAGRAALACTAVGWALHAGCVVTRGVAAGRVPWGNMYELILSACLVGSTAWLVAVVRRPSLRPLGLLVTLVLVLLLGVDGMLLYTKIGPLMPALHSYWLVIHVTAAVTASGIFLLGFAAAAATLVRTGYDEGKVRFPYPLGARLPEADALERVTFRVHALGFPIWTFAVICGAIWAEAAWGRYWGWDPKETWSFIAWVIYAGYLHARATPSVRRTVATWLAVLGWCAMMVNLFGVNLFLTGLHSYAGIK